MTPRLHTCPLCYAVGSYFWERSQPYPPLQPFRPLVRVSIRATPPPPPPPVVKTLRREHPCRRCGEPAYGHKNSHCAECQERAWHVVKTSGPVGFGCWPATDFSVTRASSCARMSWRGS
jgi:hypothetical protein